MDFILRLFIKDYNNVEDNNVRQRYGVFSSVVGIIANLLLFAFKFLAGVLTASIAITADAFNNLSDAGSSIITFVGFKMSNKKPDPDHPFGHGRFEYLTGLIVSALILIMGFELLKTSFEKILEPLAIEFSVVSVIILAVAIVVKILLAVMNFSLAKKINSPAMKATATDSLSDTISTSVVLVGTIVSGLLNWTIDGWLGLLVAGLILFAGIKSAKETVSQLLGQPPEEETVKQIEDIVMAHHEIKGIHDLVVHDYGPGRLMITLHAEVPADGDILELHDVIDVCEFELKEKMNCHATIHLDPIDVNDETTIELRNKVNEIVKNIDESISIHDFRIVKGPTHTNILFDVVTPFKFRIPDEEIATIVISEIRKISDRYFPIPNVEHSYVKMSGEENSK